MRYKKVTAAVREQRGTRACRLLRRSGKLPAVLYGGKDAEGKPQHEVSSVTVDRNEFEGLVHDGIKFIDIDLEGSEMHTIIKDLQWDAHDDHILHADFERIDLNEPVDVTVPFRFRGVSKGEKGGGRLVKTLLQATIRGLPRELPEDVMVQVDELDMDQPIRISDVPLPDSISWITEPERVVVEIRIKRAIEEETPVEEGEGEGSEAEEGAEATSE